MVVKAEQADIAVISNERTYEKYGWIILSVSALFGIVAAVVTTFPPLYVFSSSLYEGVYPMLGALGTALVGFNILALLMSLVPYRSHNRKRSEESWSKHSEQM